MRTNNHILAGIALIVMALAAAGAQAAEPDRAAPGAAHAAGDGHEHAAEAPRPDGGQAGERPGAHAEEGLRLTPDQRQRFGITVATAGPGRLGNEVRVPGEIVFNEDRVAHLTPRVAGIARGVLKTVGDRVKAGEVLAVIDSRELADAKAEYLAAGARAALADKVFAREKALREQKVSSEQDLLGADQALTEARIALRFSVQKLRALGLSDPAASAPLDRDDASITRYEIRSPIDGVVTAKHIALGESLAADADIFTVADTASVWINLAVPTRHLAAVRAGQEVVLRVDHDGVQARGKVGMVTPFVDASTRSATARVVLDNADGRWIPGTFATGFIAASEDNLPVVIPRNAVQTIEGRDVVFVDHDGSFEPLPVMLGRSDRTAVEVTAGLAPGTRYVVEGAFHLKAAVVTATLGSHAGHGH